ncbi:MAG TPA: hypothetical protein VFR61_00415 [Nitrososphaeraceae archaeon]|nr:hypothetical protein [Nitrososphaeraceae archaeon]
MSTNFRLYYIYIISLIGLVFFSTHGLTVAQPNLTIPDTFSPIQPNLTTPNTQPNLTTPNTVISNQQTEVSNPSSSITETVNEVLSGSIDGMIGDTVDMLTSNTANPEQTVDKSSLEEEIPSSLTLGKNNQTIVQDLRTETKVIGNASNSTQNISNLIQPSNQSARDSVDQIKQSFQKSMYNSTIAQSFDNNSFTKLADQNTFDNLIYKMKNILDTELFK